MRTCPNCNAINSDKNKFCVECNQYIANVKSNKDESYILDTIKKQQNQIFRKVWIVYILIGLFYFAFNIWAAIMCIDIHGDIKWYLYLLPLYIPCFIIFFFPYDKVYCKYRKKKEKPERHLSDFTLSMFHCVGVLYLLVMFFVIFDMLNNHNLPMVEHNFLQ